MRTRLLQLFLAGLLIFALAPSALATYSRINSMGGGTKYLTVEDEANVFFFPSTIVDWGNRATVDAFTGTTGLFSMHYSLNPDAVLVIYGGNLPTWQYARGRAATASGAPGPATQGAFGAPGPAPDAVDVATQPLPGQLPGFTYNPGETSNFKGAIGFGMRSGETKFGGLLSVYGDNAVVEATGAPTSTYGPLGLQLLGGVSFGLGQGSLDLGALVEFGTMTAEPGPTSSHEGEGHLGEGHFVLNLNARAFFEAAPGVDAVPYVVVDIQTMGVKVVGSGATYNTTRMGFTLGTDLKIQPASDIFIYPGAGIMFRSSSLESTIPPTTTTNTNRTFAMPFFSLAVDARIASWLDWRVGAVHVDAFNQNKNEAGPTTTTNKTSAAVVHFATGFGLTFDAWMIDFNVTPQLFNNGLWVVNGTATGPFAADVALKYVW